LYRKLLLPAVLGAASALAALAFAIGGGSSGRAYADTSIDDEEQAFWDLLTEYRVENGRPPLLIDPSIQNAAEWMSTDLGVNHYFSHTAPAPGYSKAGTTLPATTPTCWARITA
jgi:uncharacterized protein YkwD